MDLSHSPQIPSLNILEIQYRDPNNTHIEHIFIFKPLL